jgi:Tfp pilus assembly protein PilF
MKRADTSFSVIVTSHAESEHFLESKPNNATFNGNYAIFLTKIHKKHDQAEKHYKKALELEPD